MDVLMVTLRLTHVVLGAVWVGMIVLTTFFLAPAIEDSGPEGGKVMAALQRRGIMTVLPIIALGTLLSGIWLYWRFSGGFQNAYLQTPMGLAYALGGGAAILAYVLGITIMRPAMLRASSLGQTLGPTAPEVQRLRARGTTISRVVAVLLLFSVAAMAVGRYL
jgi:hypothetical protein